MFANQGLPSYCFVVACLYCHHLPSARSLHMGRLVQYCLGYQCCVKVDPPYNTSNILLYSGVCTCAKGKPAVCPELSASSITNVEELWSFSIWANSGSSDTWMLYWKTIYQLLVVGGGDIHDGFMYELGLTRLKFCSLWPWAPGLECFSNVEASLTWIVM